MFSASEESIIERIYFLRSVSCFLIFLFRMAEDNEVNDHEMSEEKNGEAMETDSKSKELADYGLNESVVTKLEELFTAGNQCLYNFKALYV